MSLLTLSNPTVSNVWNVVLDEHSEVENDLPLTFFNIKNGSSLTLIVYLNGSRAGIVEAYSMDTYIGKQFETFTVTTQDGDNLAIDDVFVQVGNNIQMTTSPYNPSWEMLEENIDVYASGCNARISCSSSTTPNYIEGLMKRLNTLVVQRRLDVQGSASLGTYEVIFDGETVLAGSAPINGVVLDTKMYRKNITYDSFSYSVTNCTIKGWIIDYFKKSHIMPFFTLVTGNLDVYDDDETTGTQTNESTNTYVTKFEVSFPETSLKYLRLFLKMNSGSGATGHAKTEAKVNNVWTEIFEQTHSTTSWVEYTNIDTTLDLTKVTGIRIQQKRSAATGNSALILYELYAFSD